MDKNAFKSYSTIKSFCRLQYLDDTDIDIFTEIKNIVSHQN